MDSPSHPDPSPVIQAPPVPRGGSPLPQGYRQGIITAITVMLGFTLAFLRFWGFEAPGDWTYKSVTAAIGLAVALILQLIALFRAVRLEDDDEAEYRITTRWFFASAAVLVVSLVLATVVFSGAF
jgi:amino acid transporter